MKNSYCFDLDETKSVLKLGWKLPAAFAKKHGKVLGGLALAFALGVNSFAQVSTGGATTKDHRKEIIGYFTNWDAWKGQDAGVPKGALTHLNIDFDKYTILNYSFFGVAKDGSLHSGDLRDKKIYQQGVDQAPGPIFHPGVYDSWDMHLMFGELKYMSWWGGADTVDAIEQGFEPVSQTKWRNTKWNLEADYPIPLHVKGGKKGVIEMAHEKGVKVMASIGGWSMSKHFPEMAADKAKRAKFLDACETLINTGFDGIDLDWEFVGPWDGMNFKGTEADYANFTTLVKEIRERIGGEKLITAAFSPDPKKLEGFEWSKLNSLMDYYNIMSYDYNGGWSEKCGHNSPLYDYDGAESKEFNWHSTYNKLMSMNVPANKLNMGVAFYGRGVLTEGDADLGAKTAKVDITVDPDGPIKSAMDQAEWKAFEGTPNYEYVRQKKGAWAEKWDDQAKVPYMTKGNHFLSYDNIDAICEKAKYINTKKCAGAIVWQVFGDLEISGSSTQHGPKLVQFSNVKSPLVNKLNEIFKTGEVTKVDKKVFESEDVLIYPTVTNYFIHVDLKKDVKAKVSVYQIDGKQVIDQNLNGINRIYVNDLNEGMYILKVDLGNNEVITKKFSKI